MSDPQDPDDPVSGSAAPGTAAPDAALPDGAHDALVIDVHDGLDDLGRATQRLDLTVVAGVAKGMVVTIVTGQPLGDEIALIGMPATITVVGGEPSVVIDD